MTKGNRAKNANYDKIMADAPLIAQRLRSGGITVTALLKKYHCAHDILVRSVLTHIPMDEWLAIRHRNLAAGCRKNKHQFKKGHKPWNKGQRGISYPGSVATQFKKGGIRGKAARKYRPVGSITIRKAKGNQYSYIKICNDGPANKRCIPLATYRWEQANGPVPEGMFVVHKDGNTLNDEPSNLVAVDRRGHCQLQQSRDPGIVIRMRENHAKSNKKTIAKANKKTSAKANKKPGVNRRSSQSLRAAWAKRMNKAMVSQGVVWECQVCGGEFRQADQPARCPKCNSLSIVRKPYRLERIG